MKRYSNLKKGLIAGAIICWVVSAAWITFLLASNNNETINIDLAGIQAREVSLGSFTDKSIKFQGSYSVIDFVSRPYDTVFISTDKYFGQIIYQGKSGADYYRAFEAPKTIENSTQKISKLELTDGNANLRVHYAKYWPRTGVYSVFIAIIVAGIIGGHLFKEARKRT